MTLFSQLYVWRMLKICGCVHFYYPTPPGARTCNMIESECIYNNKEEIKSAVIQKSTCIPNCEGTSIVLYVQMRLFLIKFPSFLYLYLTLF